MKNETALIVRSLMGLVLIPVACGCAQLTGHDSAAEKPLPPPSGDIQYASYVPENPFVLTAEGVGSRRLFENTEDGPVFVQIEEYIVAPADQQRTIRLEGGGVLEIRSGSGLAVTGKGKQELKPGKTVSIDEGEAINVQSTDDLPLVIRAYVFRIR